MKRLLRTLLFLTLILGACSQRGLNPHPTATIPTPSSKTPLLVTETATPVESIVSLTAVPTSTQSLIRLDQSIVDMPIATPMYKQCDRMDTQRVFAIDYAVYDAIKTLDPIADGFAEAMEQRCIDTNGKTFTYAISIWFYIDNKVVADLKDHKGIGSWIVDVMNLLDTIPRDGYTRYTTPSTVTFTFFADNTESLEIIVPVQEYWAKADGKSSEEVFKMFYTQP